jgi:polyvinyl alcohol dehydrogenase (cytochrome)
VGRRSVTRSLSVVRHGAASRKRLAPPETEVGVRLPWRDPIRRAADSRRRARIYREPGGKGLFTRPKSGCTYWEFDTGKGVRSAIVIGQRSDGWAAYFGDLGANVHSVDALTGKELWRTKVDDHPAAIITGSPTLVGATLFVPVSSYEEATGARKSYSCCTFRGSLVALDTATGKVLWKTYTIAEESKQGAANSAGVPQMGPSGAAIWSAPTFDAAAQRIYATTGDNY